MFNYTYFINYIIFYFINNLQKKKKKKKKKKKRYGLDIAKKIRVFEYETVMAIKKLIKDHRWEKKVELREGGTVHSYLTDLEFNEAIENIEEMRNQGLGHELIIWDRVETVKVLLND